MTFTASASQQLAAPTIEAEAHACERPLRIGQEHGRDVAHPDVTETQAMKARHIT